MLRDETLDVAWSELFDDDELDADFDRARRHLPPWFGFIPRVLALDLRRPFRPAFALWRAGATMEVGTFGFDRRTLKGTARALLYLAEDFADLARARNLFGAHFVLSSADDDRVAAAAAAVLVREADWCGMFVGEPIPRSEPGGGAERLARAYADALARGDIKPRPFVARRRVFAPAVRDGFTPRPGIGRRNGEAAASEAAEIPVG